VVGVDGLTAHHACIHFRAQLLRNGWFIYKRKVDVAEIKSKLRGKNLACFCPPGSPHCHAQVLLEVANVD
jgi:hypothetical protein